jgi:adenylate kinase family enzyme
MLTAAEAGGFLSTAKRILVLGTSGAGKTTMALFLSRRLNLQHVELDALFHGPNWTPTPKEEFIKSVERETFSGAWVVCGNYSSVRTMLVQNADAIVWLDLSFPVVFGQVFRRTIRRWYTREVLWNGNRERLWEQFFSKDSLFLWVIQTHRKKRRDYMQNLPQDKTIRLESRAEVRSLLSSMS